MNADVKRGRLLGLGLVLGATLLCVVPRAHAQANECLVTFRGQEGASFAFARETSTTRPGCDMGLAAE